MESKFAGLLSGLVDFQPPKILGSYFGPSI